MTLSIKQVTCSCGHSLEIQDRKEWCTKCGRPVFYNPKDGSQHRLNTIYVTVMLLAGIGMVVYLFMEMIVANTGG